MLHLPVPCWPITPHHVWWSVLTRALKSPRMMSLSDFGTAVDARLVARRTGSLLLQDLSESGYRH